MEIKDFTPNKYQGPPGALGDHWENRLAQQRLVAPETRCR